VGTSYAAPHVAAVLAHFISYENIQFQTQIAVGRLQKNCQFGLIDLPPNSSSWNLLVNTGIHNPDRPADKPYNDQALNVTEDIGHNIGPSS
jgi:hypothetical protein